MLEDIAPVPLLDNFDLKIYEGRKRNRNASLCIEIENIHFTKTICNLFEEECKDIKIKSKLQRKTKLLRNMIKYRFILVTMDVSNNVDNYLLSIIFSYL